MKRLKMILSGLLVCLLLIGQTAPVLAAEAQTLPAGTAGTAYSFAFPPVSGGREPFAEGNLPVGLGLRAELTESGAALHLEGTPAEAGEYSFVVGVRGEDGAVLEQFPCSLTVSPAAAAQAQPPEFTLQPVGATVAVGESCVLSVAAMVEEGTLSFLWLSGSAADISAMTAVNGGTETAATLAVPTAEAGTAYY